MLIGIRSCLMDALSIHRNPTKERTCRKVEKLPEQVLIHEERRKRISPDRVLNSIIQCDGVRSEMDHWADPDVEHCVIGIPALNDVCARKQQAAASHALTGESGDDRQVAQMQAKVRQGETLE